MKDKLVNLYATHYGHQPKAVNKLSGAGSNRQYYRIICGDGKSVIGVVGDNLRENQSFTYICSKMHDKGLPVPALIAVSDDGVCYLQEDLGSVSLYDHIQACQKAGVWDDETRALLHQVMRDLVDVQFRTAEGFDVEQCCREQWFDSRVIRWDLNYFKYCFLKLSGIPFDEMRLEDEYDLLVRELEQAGNLSGEGQQVRTFLYRDFQSRNVMVHDCRPYYIDFQGGYIGPVYYDVASFLWQARAAYPDDLREELLKEYLAALQSYCPISEEIFRERLRRFVFFRLLQVLGAYGYRGLYEHKAMFLTPIIQALRSACALVPYMENICPHLCSLILQLAQLPHFSEQSGKGHLTVYVTSFSYKKGIPDDFSGNGGGFVFDCRAPHNPGRYDEYKQLTGLDAPVIEFLEEQGEMPRFMEHAYGMVDPAVETYLRRGFTRLMVSFGCTGGQHRSVYGAQHMAEHLAKKYPDATICLLHRERGIECRFN